MREIKITAQTDGERKTAEVLIYDVIGFDFWTGGGVTAKGFADRLDELGELDEITVRINSPGGDVFDGTAIYNALVRNKARVVVEIDGLAASAASYIAMAGDEIRIAENGTMMIHQAQGGCMGDCEDMLKTAEILSKLDGTIADIYARRTNRKSETWARMMAEETWFNAEEAVKHRLADSITPNKKAIASNFAPEVLNKISKRPERIAALLKVVDSAPEEETDLEIDDEEVESPLNVAPPVDVQATLAGYAARAAEIQA